MADQRTFVLIGDFQDNITPALESINNSIAGLKRTMSTMTTKNGGGFSDVTQSVGKLVSAQIHLKKAIEDVGAAAKAATGELKDYRQEVGKVASAHYHIAKSSQQAGNKVAQGWNEAIKGIEDYGKKQKQLSNATKGTRIGAPGTLTRSPRGGGTSSTVSSFSPPGGQRGRDVNVGNFNDGFAKFTLAFGLSEAISAPITSAITAGFQIGVGMMMKPFQYFMNGMQERMQDEMSDLKAASGFFSINQMSQRKFLETGSFQEAIDFMQKNNTLMAKLAGSLPGSTQDFIEVNKRISDSIAALVTNSPERAMILAEKIRQQETSTAYAGIGPITGPPTARGMQDAMRILMADLTKQTVLAGQGTGSGTASAMGAYGLPQLTERMLTQQDISMGQMQRYAAIFRDPMIMRNLEKELPKISATMANTPERYEALRVFFERVLPPELVERYRRTLAGVQETFNTAIFSPETGIFGLGRKMKEAGGKFDEFGRMLDKFGKVTNDINQQAKVDLAIYDFVRDILANVGRVLAPIAENLAGIWDPLLNIGKLLEKARKATFEVLRSFEIYTKSFENYAKDLTPKELEKFAQTGGKELRASLATIANLLRHFGVLSDTDFKGVINQLLDVNMDGGTIFKGLLDKFLKSDVAQQIGNFLGTLVGTVLKEVSQVTGFLSGRVEGTGKLFEGLKAGFNQAGGPEAFGNIFKDIFSMLFKGLMEVAKVIPLQAYVVMALMSTLPIAVQTLSMVIANKITEGIFGLSLMQKAGGDDLFAKARAMYLLDKAKGSVGAGPAVTRTGAIASPSGVLKAAAHRNKDFPHIMVGTNPAMSMGSPRTAPRIPKPLKGGPKGMEWIEDWLAGNDDYPGAPKAKDLGKNLRVAGGELAEGFSKRLGKGKDFLKNFYKGGGFGTRLGAGGMTGLRNPVGMLGKFGTALAGLTGIISGVIRFFEKGDIFEALGAAAGPILGTILGTALLGPVGGLIGGWIGQQESVIQGLGSIFENLAGTFSTLVQLLGTLGNDILWIAGKIFGLGEDFDWLGGLMRALEMPFYYMRLGMLGIYELYLKATGRSKGPEADAVRAERIKIEEQQRLKNTLSTMYQGYTTEMKLKGLKGGLQRSTEDLAIAKAEGSKLGIAKAMAAIQTYKEQIALLEKPNKPTPKNSSTTSQTGTPVTGASTSLPSATAATQATTRTASSLANIDKKASEQIKKTTEVTTAINNLTRKTTGQSSLQTTVSSIYRLLSSGSLRVQGGPAMQNPFGSPQFNRPPATQADKGSAWVNYRLGDTGLNGVNTSPNGTLLVSNPTVNAPITINGAGQDAEQIATLVAYKIGEAVSDARSASLFT